MKKKLLFNETINSRVFQKYKSLPKKQKRPFVENIIDEPRLKKYGVRSKVNIALKSKLSEETLQKNKSAQIKRNVQIFLEEDDNSQVAPGKTEFVKSGGIRKQKRYLADNIKNLHVKYCAKLGHISYSVFCKYRPKWIVQPSAKRDTCQCKLHANMELLTKSLKQVNIITESSANEVLRNICCNVYDKKCLERKCYNCKNRVTAYHEFDNNKTIIYHEWVFEKQRYQGNDGQEKIKRVTLKKKQEDEPRNVINKFEALLISFFKHILNITVQYSAIKELKENMPENAVLCHVDFSENYSLKYNEEIQSFHFGGSRQQISLHTGVLYYVSSHNKELTCKSFCTLSKNIKHDASAIWAHLEPVLKMAQDLVPTLTTIHFLSDSPSSQYRNRSIFYMMTRLKEQVPNLNLITWNYQEAGHGKGAPDGIGAVVKRTADNHVRFGGDVATFEDFVQVVQQNTKNVELIVVAEERISEKKIPRNIPAFKGTTQVHQAIWSSSLPFEIALRSLSCFACSDSYIPCRHGKHRGVLHVGLCQESTAQSNIDDLITDRPGETVQGPLDGENSINIEAHNNVIPSEEATAQITYDFDEGDLVMRSIDSVIDRTAAAVVHDPFDDNNSIHIDTPTIFNNVGDLMEFSSASEILNIDRITENKSKIKIMSNIPVNYQRFSVHGRDSQGFSSIDQTEFEKFIQRPLHQNVGDIEQLIVESHFDHDGDTSNAMVYPDEANKENEEEIHLKYDTDDWVVVEYKTNKNSQYFVGKIIDKVHSTLEYKIAFLKKGQGKSVKFSWPVICDDDVVSEARILQRLEEPEESRRGQFTFKKIPKLNFK